LIATIIDAGTVLKNVSDSGIERRDRAEHVKNLEKLRAGFMRGYANHLKEGAKFIESAIATDRALKGD
jgi:hypothetical protein